jgi:LemA protein
VAARKLARQAYADVDVQLRRRADLVPQLIEAVRGYAAPQKALLGAVSGMRTAALAAQPPAERFGAERALGAGLKQVLGLQERYPQLKADPAFLEAQRRLAEIEEQLQYAQRAYNAAVKQYVARLESFPDFLLANLFRFRPMSFFEIEDRRERR